LVGKSLTTALLLKNLLAAAISMFVVVALGLWLSRKAGFKLALLEPLLRGESENIGGKALAIAKVSVPAGVLVGALVVAAQAILGGGLKISSLNPPAWQGFLASFYGAIGEELQCRFVLMSLLVLILNLVATRLTKPPSKVVLWTANVLAALLFAAGHLPMASALGPLTPVVVLAVMIPNTACGLVFGWLYFSRGLEAAMLAHFSTDIVLHVLVPVVLGGRV
ncbi:MAG: CPBP family intramembrane metalloprotease, partial [Cyanobacteria bacterium SZAS TMP-1]|nr:CPBP family intramembrane metalloprotease [Cyanobacteria bacterium SZAS TMP-1]